MDDLPRWPHPETPTDEQLDALIGRMALRLAKLVFGTLIALTRVALASAITFVAPAAWVLHHVFHFNVFASGAHVAIGVGIGFGCLLIAALLLMVGNTMRGGHRRQILEPD